MSREAPRRRRRHQYRLDGMRQKLYAPEIPGYVTRWINDLDTRIASHHIYDDWEFVTQEDINFEQVGDLTTVPELQLGDKISRVVGTNEGKPYLAFLMKKKKEFYDEDFKEEQSKITDNEKALKRGKFSEPIERQYGSLKVDQRNDVD